MRFTFSSLSFKIMSYDTAAINAAALKELLSMTVKKLTSKQKILVAGTLFGMFFGAGNLIFPVHLGQMAGSNVIPAIIGFIITAPYLWVGDSRSMFFSGIGSVDVFIVFHITGY